MIYLKFLDFNPHNSEIVGRKFAENPGGKGDNQAVAGGRSGGDITFLGAIGDD